MSLSVKYTWNKTSVNFSLVVLCNVRIELIYLNHLILSSWWVLYLLNLTNFLLSIKVCMMLLSPYLNFSTLTLILFCNRRTSCAIFSIMFMNEKWVKHFCPEGIYMKWSNTLPAVVIILVELSTNFITSKIFLWRSKMLSCLLSWSAMNSNVVGIVYLLFLNVKSSPYSIFLMNWVWLRQTRSWSRCSWCHLLVSRRFF